MASHVFGNNALQALLSRRAYNVAGRKIEYGRQPNGITQWDNGLFKKPASRRQRQAHSVLSRKSQHVECVKIELVGLCALQRVEVGFPVFVQRHDLAVQYGSRSKLLER